MCGHVTMIAGTTGTRTLQLDPSLTCLAATVAIMQMKYYNYNSWRHVMAVVFIFIYLQVDLNLKHEMYSLECVVSLME